MASRRRPPDPGDDSKLIAAIQRIETAGDRLAIDTIRSFERARRELLGRLLDGSDAPMDVQHSRMILVLVDEQIAKLYGDLSSTYGQAISDTIREQGEQAIVELRRLPIWAAADQALLVSQGITSPRLSFGMVQAAVEKAGDRIVAVNAQLKAQIRGQVTQSIIRGESVQKAAKRILGEGLSQDGLIKPFPSIYDRARTIAKTEIADSANLAHLAKYQQAEALMPGLLVRWCSVLCSTTCAVCRGLAGLAPRRPGEFFTYSSGKRSFSGPCPCAHPKCMCRLVAVLPP